MEQMADIYAEYDAACQLLGTVVAMYMLGIVCTFMSGAGYLSTIRKPTRLLRYCVAASALLGIQVINMVMFTIFDRDPSSPIEAVMQRCVAEQPWTYSTSSCAIKSTYTKVLELHERTADWSHLYRDQSKNACFAMLGAALCFFFFGFIMLMISDLSKTPDRKPARKYKEHYAGFPDLEAALLD